jgi:myo-inositol-1(or 4)-monophosphatase
VNPWDKYPLIPIVTGAGGVITGWDGSDVSSSESVVAAHPNIHSKVLSILNPI